MALRPRQRADATLLFAWNFCAVAAFFVGRTVRDALFLAHESPSQLPLMYIASPLVVTAMGFAYARVADGVRRDRLVRGTSVLLAGLALAAWLALGPRWLYYALYAGIECMGALIMMQFWLSASERFSPREAKQVFGRIAAGGTVANMVVGLALSRVVAFTGAENLLLLCVGFLVAVAVLSTVLFRRPGPAAANPHRGRPTGAGKLDLPAAAAPGTSHLRVLLPMIVLGVIASVLLDFQFKVLATRGFQGDRDAMVQFFSLLSAATGTISLLIQFVITGRVLEHLGVAGALLLLPGSLGLSAIALLVAPSLITATACKAAEQTLRYTVNDSGMQLLYLPVPSGVRSRRKAFLDGVVRPATEASVGGALFVYRAVAGTAFLPPIALASVAITAAWVAAVVRMRGAYASSLAETLRRRRILTREPADRPTRDTERAVASALRSGELAEIRHGLELARLAPAPVAGELQALVRHAEPSIRAQALACLREGGVALDPALLAVAVADEAPEVRAAAALAAGAEQLDQVRTLFADRDASVASAAAATLCRLGPATDRRAVMARLGDWLDGEERRERRAGLEAARVIGAPELVAPLVRRLAVRADARLAVEALIAIGAPAEPALAAAAEAPATAAPALAALGRLTSPAARARAVAALTSVDEHRRDAAAASLARARHDDADLPLDDAALVAAARDELMRGFTAMAAAAGLGRAESALLPDGTRALVPYRPDTIEGPAALISRALRERHERARDRIFHLLGAVQPDLAFEDVRVNLREVDPVRRSNAVELLHAQRWRAPLAELKPLVMALIDDSTRDAKLAAVTRRLDLPNRTVDGWTLALLSDDRPWMIACAAYFAAAAGVIAALPRLAALTAHPDPMVRDAAGAARHRLDHPDAEPTMLTIADKVLFLKGIELFTAIHSEDLAEIAAVTHEVTLDEGETAFTSGDRGDALYLIVEGRVRIHVDQRTLAELGERDVFGEMALLDPAPRSASATAISGTVVLRLGQDDFANVLADRSEVAVGILRVLSRRLRAANRE